MKKLSLSLLLVMLSVFTAAIVFAQSTNFSGTWNFKSQESVLGKLYANGSPKEIMINAIADNLKLISVTAYSDGNDTTKEELSENDAFKSKTSSGRKKITSFKWSGDKSSFIAISSIYSLTDGTKLDFKISDVWTISAGKLILDRKNENFTNGETWESKATYENANSK